MTAKSLSQAKCLDVEAGRELLHSKNGELLLLSGCSAGLFNLLKYRVRESTDEILSL